MGKNWPKWLDHLNDFDNKIGTLVKRQASWWGDMLIWEVDGKTVTTNTNSSPDFKDAELGVKGKLHFNTLGNFWTANKLS
jgi:hypothetical protein